MTTALVIGAGVAGPVAAMALQRAGVEAALVEARGPGEEDGGAFLTLEPNGIDALRAVGADGPVLAVGVPTPSMVLRSGSGKVLGRVGTGAPLADGTVAVTLRRADLHRALRGEAERRGIALRTGARLVDATTGPDGVRAVFADGTTATADLLVGADGLRSRVRSIIDPDAAPARYLPVLNTGGFAPPQDTGGRPGEYEMVFGKRAFFGHLVAPDGVWWFANPPRRTEPAPGELAAMTSQQWRELLLELFADDRSPAARIIASTPHALTGWTTYDVPRVRHWHRGRLVVIGDAAHATAPSSGQGASLAIEDAVELARCVRDLPDPPAAFAAFVALRRRRVERVVAEGRRTSSTKAAGPVGRVVRDAVMPLVLRAVAGRSRDWLHGHHVEWDAPVTAATPVR